MSTPKHLYACLYVSDFPAQAILRLRPESQNHACIVLDGEPPFQQVCSLNQLARLRGIEHGMTRVEIDTFPGVTVFPRDLHAEQSARSLLLECAAYFSPRIEDCSGNMAFLCCIDIGGTERLFGTPKSLAQSLLLRVEANGLMAGIAISHNFHAAACLVKGTSQPNHLQVIADGQEAAALAALPISVLDVTEPQAETFAIWGIHTLGMLAALPEKELIARISDGQRLRQMARGESPHHFQPLEQPLILENRLDLDTPVDMLDSLLFVIGVLLDQLLQRVKEHLLALASVRINLLLHDGKTYSRTVRPAAPTNDKQIWIKLLHLDLDAHTPQSAIVVVALRAEPGATSNIQLGMFSPQVPEATRLDVTLARIRALVGEKNVGHARLTDTHAPNSFRVDPFTVPQGEPAKLVSLHPRSAVRQLRPPEVVSMTLNDSRPAVFFFRRCRYTVEQAYGPWLAEGDWWNQTLWGFEQWDLIARANDNSLLFCCMTHDLMHGKWRMASLYD